MSVNQRSIIRRIKLTPGFHQVDMMGVVHNCEYFHWFEEGRLQIMQEVIALQDATELGVAAPVVENICRYFKFAGFGDSLLLTTIHKIVPVYQGKLKFSHSLVNEKTREEIACGESTVTLIEFPSKKLLKEWPADLWVRYQNLK